MNSSLARSVVVLFASCSLSAVALAQPDQPRTLDGACVDCNVAPKAALLVPDAVLDAMRGREAIFSLRAGPDVSGTVLSFNAENVTLTDATGRVLALPRTELVAVHVPVAAPAPQLSAAPTKVRHIGLQVSQGVANVLLDLDYGHFYGFVGTSIGYPIIFSGGGGNSQFVAFAVGLGGSWKLSPRSLWKFDLMGTFTPTSWGGFSMGIGVAAGFHYTSPSGFTFGFKLPIIGVAPGCNTILGSSNYNYDTGTNSGCSTVSGGTSLIGNYFMQAGMSLPVVSLGYRF